MAKQSGIGEEFLGLIVLPIAGNACEHITAVFVAVKDKMDLAIGVALGSSIQVCALRRRSPWQGSLSPFFELLFCIRLVWQSCVEWASPSTLDLPCASAAAQLYEKQDAKGPASNRYSGQQDASCA